MTLWGGRFGSDPSRLLWDYTVDTTDRRLLPFDLRASSAHAAMLGSTGVISKEESNQIVAALAEIGDEEFAFSPDDEDVHSAIERRLIEKVGDLGEKLHTGRSRNDQVAVALRLYLRHAASERRSSLGSLIDALLDQAETHVDTPIPSYTHLQQAQTTTLAQHLLAHAWVLSRNIERLVDLDRRLSVSPLGAGPSTGSSLPLDPSSTAVALGFDRAFANPMDAVGSRDLATEFAYVATQALVDISRLAEELILWASSEFGWLSLDDAFATGSSALPQKKNPDIAELARGRGAVAIGRLTSLLALQKGLPLTYNRDLQEDKEVVFWLDDTLAGTCSALAGMISSARFDPPPPTHLTEALGIAENMVRRGIPFRSAHAAVGRLVVALEGKGWEKATADELAQSGVERSDLETQPTRGGLEVTEQIALLRALAS